MKNKIERPLVSVCIPVYNHEKFITECIESVVNQTYENIELIVIDDGSKDNSVNVIQELAYKYRFTFIHRSNRGLSVTLNEGIKLSKGKYISFLASDDFWEPTKIAKQVDMMENDQSAVISFTEFQEVDEDSNIKKKGIYSFRKNPFYNFENVLIYADLPPASLFVKREYIEQVGGFKEDLKVEDLYIWLKLLENGGYAKVLQETLAYYRIHRNNTHLNELMITKEHFKIISMFLQGRNRRFKKNILSKWALRNANILARHHKREALYYWKYISFGALFDIRLYKIIFKLIFR